MVGIFRAGNTIHGCTLRLQDSVWKAGAAAADASLTQETVRNVTGNFSIDSVISYPETWTAFENDFNGVVFTRLRYENGRINIVGTFSSSVELNPMNALQFKETRLFIPGQRDTGVARDRAVTYWQVTTIDYVTPYKALLECVSITADRLPDEFDQ